MSLFFSYDYAGQPIKEPNKPCVNLGLDINVIL